jgi:hypothetical protein
LTEQIDDDDDADEEDIRRSSGEFREVQQNLIADVAAQETREALRVWIAKAQLKSDDHLFPSRLRNVAHLSTRQYARVVHRWVAAIGLDPTAYGTHSMRRTKATLIYRRTKKPSSGSIAARP